MIIVVVVVVKMWAIICFCEAFDVKLFILFHVRCWSETFTKTGEDKEY